MAASPYATKMLLEKCEPVTRSSFTTSHLNGSRVHDQTELACHSPLAHESGNKKSGTEEILPPKGNMHIDIVKYRSREERVCNPRWFGRSCWTPGGEEDLSLSRACA